MTKATWRTCSRGHRFQKSSSCPICPICWSGYYKEKWGKNFPEGLGAPALRALLGAKLTKLADLGRKTENEISELHSMGPKALGILKAEMKKRGFSFKK